MKQTKPQKNTKNSVQKSLMFQLSFELRLKKIQKINKRTQRKWKRKKKKKIVLSEDSNLWFHHRPGLLTT